LAPLHFLLLDGDLVTTGESDCLGIDSISRAWQLDHCVAFCAVLRVHARAGNQGISLTVLLISVALAGLGELVEMLGSSAGAAKKGASRRAMILSLLGTFAGSVTGATVGTAFLPPLGTIVGAILGGSVGAYIGAYLGEVWKGNQAVDRLEIGRAAFVGRILGVVGKMAIGVIILVIITVDSFI